jgi:hypothetical protein
MACCAPLGKGTRGTGALASGLGAMIAPRSEAMQLRLDLAECPAPGAALWELVGAEQRQTAMTLLAALIARAVAGEEVLDDRAQVGDQGALGGRDD